MPPGTVRKLITEAFIKFLQDDGYEIVEVKGTPAGGKTTGFNNKYPQEFFERVAVDHTGLCETWLIKAKDQEDNRP